MSNLAKHLFEKGYTPYNKGKHIHDEKVKVFLKTGLAYCEKHGEHSNFRVREELHRIWCRLCEQEYHKNDMETNKLGLLVTWAKNRKKKSCNITKKYLEKILEKQDFKCALTGRRFSDDLSDASLDRIDSNKGYIYGNVQLVLAKVNIMKNDMPQEDFIKACGEVWNHYNAKN